MAAPLSSRKAFGNVSNVAQVHSARKPSMKTAASGPATVKKGNFNLNLGKPFNENTDDLDLCQSSKKLTDLKKPAEVKPAPQYDPIERMILPDPGEHHHNMTEDLFNVDTMCMEFDEDMPSYLLQRNKPQFNLDWL